MIVILILILIFTIKSLSFWNLQLSRDLHSSIVEGRFPKYVYIYIQLLSSPFLSHFWSELILSVQQISSFSICQ